jgi:sulfur carrier protein ThiS
LESACEKIAPMKVQVHLYGTLRRFSQPQTPGLWLGDVPSGATIRDLITQIGTSEREVAVASINGKACPFEVEIPEGAKVILVTNMGAG